jgi:hypothetical protein
MFIAFRFFAGAGSWGFLALSESLTVLQKHPPTIAAPVYSAELAHVEFRGVFVGMNRVLISVEYSLASYMGLTFYFSTNISAQWRVR